MGINSRSAVDPRWRKSSRQPLLGFCVATIEIIAPNTLQLGADYNPWTNAFPTDPKTVIYTGDAQMEYYRQPHPTNESVGDVTSERQIRFTLKDDGPVADIITGMWINITACVDQPDLMHYQFIVTSGLTLPLGFMRTIETQVNLKNVGA